MSAVTPPTPVRNDSRGPPPFSDPPSLPPPPSHISPPSSAILATTLSKHQARGARWRATHPKTTHPLNPTADLPAVPTVPTPALLTIISSTPDPPIAQPPPCPHTPTTFTGRPHHFPSLKTARLALARTEAASLSPSDPPTLSHTPVAAKKLKRKRSWSPSTSQLSSPPLSRPCTSLPHSPPSPVASPFLKPLSLDFSSTATETPNRPLPFLKSPTPNPINLSQATTQPRPKPKYFSARPLFPSITNLNPLPPASPPPPPKHQTQPCPQM